MAEKKIVLCRADISESWDEEKFCCKPITKPNANNFCDEHLASFPLWPQ